MNIQLATDDQVSQIMLLISGVIQQMESQGIFQWDESYPNQEAIEKGLSEGTLYTATVDDMICGIIALNEHQEQEYQQVDWEFYGDNVLVVHRLAVNRDWHGKGVGSELMDFAEQFAREHRYDAIRLDAFTRNPAAVALYKSRGYRLAGLVTFRKGPFYCFEKDLLVASVDLLIPVQNSILDTKRTPEGVTLPAKS